MARGQKKEIGDSYVAQNGYHYTKVATKEKPDGEFRLTHHIIAEKMLGRPLRGDERVRFKGSKRDLRPDNIEVVEKGKGSVRRRIAQIEARIEELQAEKDELLKELQGPIKIDHSK